MAAADDWWITLPAARRDQIHQWVTKRRRRRPRQRKPPKPSPPPKPTPTPPGQESLFGDID